MSKAWGSRAERELNPVAVEVWEERDRLHVHVTRGGETVAEWWDDEAREMFTDGFFERGRQLEASVLSYCEERGIL